MKILLLIISLMSSSLLLSCTNEPKETDKLLSDYKKHQLERAKKVEQEMNQRLDNLNKQLDELEENTKDDPQ